MTLPRPADALRHMLDQPEVFKAVQRDLDKHARNLLKKQVKAAKGVKSARAIHGVLGDDLIFVGLEQLSVRDVLILLKRLDRHNDGISDMPPLEQRNRLSALFTGKQQPEEAPRKSDRTAPSRPAPRQEPPAQPVTEADKFFRHKSMGARRKAGSRRSDWD